MELILQIMTGSSFGILCLLLFILVLNLSTFHRLHAPQNHSGLATPLGTNSQAHIYSTKGKIGKQLDQSWQDSTQVAQTPFLSILVPARNEEDCIKACLRSLIMQDYEPFEVLLLDDQSTDRTAALVQRLINDLPHEQQGRLRYLSGQPLPDGWIGKNFACHQLAEQAQGNYLLFTDADTIHAPGMAAAVVDYMQQSKVQLLTALPEQIVESLGERLVVPLMNFTILSLLPVPLIRWRPEASLSTGIGQLLCFERASYQAIGGHMAVKGRILEDVWLARTIKAAGYQMAFIDAFELVHCRMYHSFQEVWQGFSKNLFAFYNYALPFAAIALILNLLLFVVPILLIPLALWLGLADQILLFSLGSYLLATLMHSLLTLRFTRTHRLRMLLINLCHPISIVLECLILLNSIYWHYRKTGTLWKGRSY